jgi:hypothetical protein
MILDLTTLLTRHGVVAVETARDLRVAFLKTTEPTFLVFRRGRRHPSFVVKIGDRAALDARAAITSRLHALLPGIARPIGVLALDHRRGMFVEEGLPGVPWFRLGDVYKTPSDWHELRARAIDKLHEFHAAVAAQPEWVAAPRTLDSDVRSMVVALGDDLSGLGASGEGLLQSTASEFASLGAIGGISQHGDFVLNNLLVDAHQMAIIDLADFGRWQVPFLDAFALGHSVNVLAREHVAWGHLADDLAACSAAEVDAGLYTPRQKMAFFVYFLLAAMLDTLQKPTRTAIRSIYRATLRDLLDHPSRYERAFAAALPQER